MEKFHRFSRISNQKSDAQRPDLSYQSQVETAVNEQAIVYPDYLTSYEGHKVTFRLIDDDKWTATVRKNLPTGFINEILLPVFISEGITMNQLLEATPDFQKRHIHVVFPKSYENKKGFVYIGNVGLKGGGPGASRLYTFFDGFTPLSNHITWPTIRNCSVGEAIAAVAKTCAYEASYLWMTDRSRGPFRSGQPKCNLFVAEVLANIGVYAGATGESAWRRLILRIPTACDWANDRIPDFNRTSYPRPGCIVAQKHDYVDANCHVGIVVGYRETVSACADSGGRLCINNFGFRTDPDYKGIDCGGHIDDVIYLEHMDSDRVLDTIRDLMLLRSLNYCYSLIE